MAAQAPHAARHARARRAAHRRPRAADRRDPRALPRALRHARGAVRRSPSTSSAYPQRRAAGAARSPAAAKARARARPRPRSPSSPGCGRRQGTAASQHGERAPQPPVHELPATGHAEPRQLAGTPAGAIRRLENRTHGPCRLATPPRRRALRGAARSRAAREQLPRPPFKHATPSTPRPAPRDHRDMQAAAQRTRKPRTAATLPRPPSDQAPRHRPARLAATDRQRPRSSTSTRRTSIALADRVHPQPPAPRGRRRRAARRRRHRPRSADGRVAAAAACPHARPSPTRCGPRAAHPSARTRPAPRPGPPGLAGRTPGPSSLSPPPTRLRPCRLRLWRRHTPAPDRARGSLTST